MSQKIKVTYSTLASPNPLLDELFDAAVERTKATMGQTFPMLINGQERMADETFTKISPVDNSTIMGYFQKGTEQDAEKAVAAARAAFDGWYHTPWQERVALLRKAADLISERLFEMGAVMSLEVGKNRLEALGDVEETADLIRYYCDQMEENEGFSFVLNSESARHHTL
jgi:1-pyrroline-5-carboxylate dehydrogenase